MEKTSIEYRQMKEKFDKQIIWDKSANEAWVGRVMFKDGYQLSMAARPDAKMRAAKASIKEDLFDRALAIAEERGTEILFQK